LGDPLEATKIVHRAQAARRAKLSNNLMLASLIMSRRPETAGRRRLKLDPLDKSIKGKIEVEPCLLAICYNVQAGIELIANGRGDGIIDQFGAIGFTELAEMLNGNVKPCGERVAANNGCSQGLFFHANRR
jgi:hypothetical protein